jgi:hypothetical protein
LGLGDGGQFFDYKGENVVWWTWILPDDSSYTHPQYIIHRYLRKLPQIIRTVVH